MILNPPGVGGWGGRGGCSENPLTKTVARKTEKATHPYMEFTSLHCKSSSGESCTVFIMEQYSQKI